MEKAVYTRGETEDGVQWTQPALGFPVPAASCSKSHQYPVVSAGSLSAWPKPRQWCVNALFFGRGNRSPCRIRDPAAPSEKISVVRAAVAQC